MSHLWTRNVLSIQYNIRLENGEEILYIKLQSFFKYKLSNKIFKIVLFQCMTPIFETIIPQNKWSASIK